MRRRILLAIIFWVCMWAISPVAGQLAVSDSETYYTLNTTTATATPVTQTVGPLINFTTAGIGIRDTPVGQTIIGVGLWTGRTSYFPDHAYINASFSGVGPVLNVTHTTSSDYGILWYTGGLTTAIQFEVWVYVTDTTRQFRCMWSDGGVGYGAGFIFSEGTIHVANSAQSNIENTGIAVPTGWNHFYVNWTSGGTHYLWQNGGLIHTKTSAYTETSPQTLEIGTHQPTTTPATFYVYGLAVSNEPGYSPFMAWNQSRLSTVLTVNSNVVTASVQNLSVRLDMATNSSTRINTTLYNTINSTWELVTTQCRVGNVSTLISVPVYARNYLNSTGYITLQFVSYNLTQAFIWNLTQMILTIWYWEQTEVTLLDVEFNLDQFWMLGYIAVCFAIFLYLVVHRQKDEPVLIPFILVVAIPMLTPEYWELGLLFLAFFVYRCLIQIYRKMHPTG